MSFEVRVSTRAMKSKKNMRVIVRVTMIVVLVATVGVALGAYLGTFAEPKEEVFLIAMAGVAMGVATVAVSASSLFRRPSDPDQRDRALMAQFQQFEKNVKQDILKQLSGQVTEQIVPLDFVTREIQKRLDEGLVKAIDDALRERLTEGAKWVDVVSYIEDAQSRISVELNGPAGRAERLAQWLLLAAMLAGALGLGIAAIRVFTLGNLGLTLVSLSAAVGEKSAWPFILALAAPWISLIGLVEFSALLLFKVSNQFLAEQRKYTELHVSLSERLLALKVIVRSGSGDDVAKAASQLLRDVQDIDPKGASIEESVSAITKITESLATIVKQFASKEAKAAD